MSYVHGHELTPGRTFAVNFDHDEDFFDALDEFCKFNNVRQGYVPMFVAAFSEVDVVGACDKLENPRAPVWSKTHLSNVEAMGSGTIAWDEEGNRTVAHFHTSVGLKEQSANGFTSHLLSARVQFLTEMLLVEITHPTMTRLRNSDLYDVTLLTFSDH